MLDKTAARLWVLLIFVGVAAEASDPAPRWSHRWDANVWNDYCDLKLDYSIPFRHDVTRRGLLANTGYDAAFVRFVALTRMHGSLYRKVDLFKVKFGLSIYGENGDLPAPNNRISSARIGDFELDPPKNTEFWIHNFSLDEDAISKLMNIFRANERVEVTIRFENGEERTSTIFPSGDHDFHVWEAMFQTCVQKNIGPRR